MHCGSLNGKTAAGRVFRLLDERRSEWLTGWELTMKAQTTAVSTRISEVRHQLPPHLRLEHRTTREGHEYRLVWVGAVKSERQMALMGQEGF